MTRINTDIFEHRTGVLDLLIILIFLFKNFVNHCLQKNLCSSDKSVVDNLIRISVVDNLIRIICGLGEVIEYGGIATGEDSTRHTTELVCGSAAIERYIVVDEVGIA